MSELELPTHSIEQNSFLSTIAPATKIVAECEVAIIGSGFSGLGLGMRLSMAGMRNFIIFERAKQLGGTWRDNFYPGARCDIQTDLYSYSFAPNLKWSGLFASQQEILDYLIQCAEHFNLAPHLRFDHQVESAIWDSNRQRWVIDTKQGRYLAKVLVGAMGYLCEPKYPEIAGLESFSGQAMHTARWDKSCELAGKRVAVIGTGASAIQVIPAIQPQVAKLDVYQRTPPWIMSKHDRMYGNWESWAFRHIPGFHFLKRHYHRLTAELVPWQLGKPYRTYPMKVIARSHLYKSVTDPELRKRLEPDYAIGCRRMLFSDTYYQSIQQPNAELVDIGIDHIEPDGIVTADGKLRKTDVLVMATGFHAAKQPFAKLIHDETGKTLWETWEKGQYAYLGSTVSGYPNFFMILGPNATVGHTSATVMMEAQHNYIVDAIRLMNRNNIGSVDVKTDVIQRFNQKLQKRLSPMVWTAGGCSSYYLDESGTNTTIWPGTALNFHHATKRFDVKNYNITPNASRNPS
jgi:cation diffusion facilitator CzcD-associated flavoprotein CzcO